MGQYTLFQYYERNATIKNYYEYIIKNIGDEWITRPDFLRKTGMNAATLTQRMQKLEAGGYVRVTKERVKGQLCLLYKVLKPYDGKLEAPKKKNRPTNSTRAS